MASDLRSQLDNLKSRMPLNQPKLTPQSDMPPQELVQVPYSQPIHQVTINGQQAPINEIHELHPLGYSFYHYFDSKQLEVNGECLVPIWHHGVVLPNIFFI